MFIAVWSLVLKVFIVLIILAFIYDLHRYTEEHLKTILQFFGGIKILVSTYKWLICIDREVAHAMTSVVVRSCP